MHSKNIFRIWTITAILVLITAACSPKPAPDAPADLPQDSPAEQPGQDPFNQTVLGDCYNPFNPVIKGKVWSYSIQTGDIANTQKSSFKDVTSSSFTSVQEYPDITTEVAWTCSPDGLLSSEFASMNITQVQDVDIETIGVSGVVFPHEDLWQVGYSWDVVFNVKIAITIEDTVFEGEGEISQTNTIASVEPVGVLAGTYPEAYRVDSTGNFKIVTLGVESNIPTSYSTWYVKNVGMVKSSSDDPGFSYITELISWE